MEIYGRTHAEMCGIPPTRPSAPGSRLECMLAVGSRPRIRDEHDFLML